MFQRKIGIFAFFMLTAVCAWPLSAIGFGENASIIGGVILAVVVIGVAANINRRDYIDATREAVHGQSEFGYDVRRESDDA